MPQNPSISVSQAVKREMLEYENEEEQLFYELDMIEGYGKLLLGSMGLFYVLIGIIFLIGLLTAGTEESCLSC